MIFISGVMNLNLEKKIVEEIIDISRKHDKIKKVILLELEHEEIIQLKVI